MKKALIILLAVLMACSSTLTASASESKINKYESMTIEELAYCELDKAPNESIRQRILDARDVVVHNTSWTVNGQMYVQYPDGTIEELPEFTELFPGWELPKGKESIVVKDAIVYYDGIIYMNKSSTTSRVDPFTTITALNNDPILVEALSIPGTSWNGAITDMITGEEIGNKVGLPVGTMLVFPNVVRGVYYGIRASSNYVSGQAHMVVMQGKPQLGSALSITSP